MATRNRWNLAVRYMGLERLEVKNEPEKASGQVYI